AKEKGYFKEVGLDVEIVTPGEGPGVEALVANGTVDFGVSYQENVTMSREQDIPVVSIAAIIQHNTSSLARVNGANIKSAKDLEGKTYGGWGSASEIATLQAIMKEAGADYDKLEVATLGQLDFFQAIGKEADLMWIYDGWTGVEAKLKGIEINKLAIKDLEPRLDYYTPVLITSEKYIAEKSEIVKSFMTATAKGYELAIENPKEAAKMLIKNVDDANEKLIIESQKYLADKYKEDAPQWGYQESTVWSNYAAFLTEYKLLKKPFQAEKAFTNDFLPEQK
ncbi:MAG: ABC transporter substrate-binding protein, partial [Bacilli bacterium]